MTTQDKFALESPRFEPADCAPDGSPSNKDAVAGIDRTVPSWLGLVTTHRRLFEASQDGWIRPPLGSCLLLGHESFVSEELSAGRNFVPVRLVFDVSKLPFPDVRKDVERDAAENNDGDAPRVLRWRAPIPLYAVKRVEVSSMEHKARLLAMARQMSNVSLPVADVDVGDFQVPPPAALERGTPEGQSMELPDTLNGIQGAMAMAVWAVPRVEPWIEVLQRALSLDATGVAEVTRSLDAQWLQIPWLVHDLCDPGRDDADDQERLWRAALHCMQWSMNADKSPGEFAERIAQAACLNAENRTAEAWLDETRRIVAAEEPIACNGWRENGAGIAIRLALLRPEPMRFKSWSTDLPGLPPAVWWAAATLCGWRHGFRILDRKFRGNTELQEFIATRALAACWPSSDSAVLHPSQQSSLERLREDGWFLLTWSGHPVIRKSWQSRAKWYIADLTDAAVGKAARSVARQLAWPCFERWFTLPEGRVPTVGSGRLSVDGDTLVVKGKKSFQLSNAGSVEERFDAEDFRRRLATEGGVVPAPPETSRRKPLSEPPGLIYRPDFITEEEEKKLLACIDENEWSNELQRRVQHYGWRYDYTKRRIDENHARGRISRVGTRIGSETCERRVDEGLTRPVNRQRILRAPRHIGPHRRAE